jgi:hypothetical protein
MLKCEKYMMFRGVMRITFTGKKPIEVYSTWLYRPDVNFWYGNGSSYHESICEVILDETL